MRMCNNRLLDLQDTSLDVTLDTAGNISSQSFLLNLQYLKHYNSAYNTVPAQQDQPSHRIIGSAVRARGQQNCFVLKSLIVCFHVSGWPGSFYYLRYPFSISISRT